MNKINSGHKRHWIHSAQKTPREFDTFHWNVSSSCYSVAVLTKHLRFSFLDLGTLNRVNRVIINWWLWKYHVILTYFHSPVRIAKYHFIYYILTYFHPFCNFLLQKNQEIFEKSITCFLYGLLTIYCKLTHKFKRATFLSPPKMSTIFYWIRAYSGLFTLSINVILTQTFSVNTT